MAKNYSYPRVTLSTYAKKHSHNVINVPDTTVMFAPLVTEKGPDDRIVKIHTLAEFIETFGSFNEEFYNLNGQMALNIYNWLSNGGTLMVKRLTTLPEEVTESGITIIKDKKSQKALSASSILSITTTANSKITYNAENVDFEFNVANLLEGKVETGKILNNEFYETGDANDDGSIPGIIISAEIVNINTFLASFKETKTENKFNGDSRFTILFTKNKVLKSTKDEKDVYTIKKTETEKRIYILDVNNENTTGSTFIYRYDSSNIRISISKKVTYPTAYDKNDNSINGFFIDGNCVKTSHDTCTHYYKGKNKNGVVEAVAMAAKYSGEYYNNIYLEVNRVGKNIPAVFNFTVYYEDPITKKATALEKFLQKTEENYMAALSSSEYIEVFNIKDDLFFEETDDKKIPQSKKYTLSGGLNAISNYEDTLDAIKEYWEIEGSDPTTEDTKKRYLVNRLETPIDIIFDAGYPDSIKDAMVNFVRNDGNDGIDAKRNDIVCILDNWQLSNDLRLSLPNEINYSVVSNAFSTSVTRPTNVAIYEQYFTILDDTFTNQNIYVTPTYFLTKLFAYNDQTYGLQYPTAGLRRGILDDAIAVNLNPSPDQKEAWFVERVNYVEKTSREYAFMSQRTFDGSSDMEYTALSFLNNERVVERMKKDLEALGRSYLHEFNDAVTIANMTTALNKYVANWISNRTLSMGVVTVEQNAVSENALDINLNIRFTNTIEVIHVSIVIE